VNSISNLLDSISVSSPLWLLVTLPIILIFSLDWNRKKNSGMIYITDLEYLRSHYFFSFDKKRRLFRTITWSILIFAVGVLWAGPNFHSKQPLFAGGNQVVYQKFLIMLDISRSMSVPLGEELNMSLPGQVIVRSDKDDGEKIPRFQAARAALMDFVNRFNEAQIGLILFSAEPILARWPTVETKDMFWEVLEENIGRGIISQIQSFSSLTNTDKALLMARKIFSQQGAREGAVIVISDAEDDIENMGVAVRNLRNDGIRVYTIGVGISEIIAESLSQKFSHDPGFRIFHVDSEEEMQEAYRLVAEVEESLPFELNQKEYINELRWLLSLALVVVGCILLWVLEVVFHQSQSAGNVETIEGAKRGIWFS
jgi:hypothetical protein